jgi:hypothetical protein
MMVRSPRLDAYTWPVRPRSALHGPVFVRLTNADTPLARGHVGFTEASGMAAIASQLPDDIREEGIALLEALRVLLLADRRRA